jgi:hypothetical protein
MTPQEFDNTGFGSGMKVIYKDSEYLLGSVDFEERLIGIVTEEDFKSGDYTYDWIRCENCELIS